MTSNNNDELNPQKNMIGVSLKDSRDAYNKVVRPAVALALPGYMHRWVSQQIGADGFWMYASLFQNAYGLGARMNDPNASSFAGRFSAKQICRYGGISQRTFWNRMGDVTFLEKLKPLVTVYDEPKLWDKSSSTPRQLARRFEVETTLPLTPNDTASLRAWIMDRLEELGLEDVLRAAAATPRKELLTQQGLVSEPAMTVEDLVVSLLGDQLDHSLLRALASRIHNNIMPGNDQINITLYFMEHVLPHLGTDGGYMLTLMRDKCFVSYEETRDIVKFTGGYDEIGELMGMKNGEGRARTIWNYLNAKYPKSHKEAGKYRNSVLRLYISEIAKDEPELDFAHQTRTFRVLLDEIPLELCEAALTGQGFYAELFDSDICSHGVAEIAQHPIWGKYQFNFCSLGVSTFAQGDFNFCSLGVSTFAVSAFQLLHRAVSTFAEVKALKLLNQALKTNQPIPVGSDSVAAVPVSEPEGTGQGSQVTQNVPGNPGEKIQENPVGRSVWNFSILTQISNINQARISDMAASVPNEHECALRFAGWILYAHSPKAKNLNDSTGVGLAISSIRTRPDNAFMHLANLGPEKLRSLFDRDFARTLGEDTREELIYRAQLKRLPLHRKQDLYYRLFGVDAPEPAAILEEPAAAASVQQSNEPAPIPFKVPRRQIQITK